MPQLSISYHVVAPFDAILKNDGSPIRLLPGESVYLQRDRHSIVTFESTKGTCKCDKITFRFATMKLLTDFQFPR